MKTQTTTLHPEQRIVAGQGEDRETGTIDHIEGDTAIIRWDQGIVTPCPIDEIEAE